METNDFQGIPDLSDLFLPPADFDPFKAGNDALRTSLRTRGEPKEVEYDLSEVNELYGGLGIGDYKDALVGGFTDVAAATLEGGAAMYGSATGDYSLARSMARYREHLDDAITGDIPDELKQKFSYKAVNAIGAMPMYMGLAAGTAASGGTAGAAALALRGASWAALGSNAYQQGRDDYIATIGATDRDLTDEEMQAANKNGAMTMIPLMVLERVGANTLVNSLFRGTGGRATVGDITKRLVQAPLAEAGTEGTQTLYQNFLASELANYDPDRPINQGVVESMLLGAIASGSFSTPANLVQMRAEKLAENIDSGNINAEEMADELGRSLLSAGMDADSIPATGSDEAKIRHTRGATMKFIDAVLTPLTTKLSKAGMEYKRAFRDFERRTGVQQSKAKEVIAPFIEKMKRLNKISQEDYDTLSNALANVGIINKGNQTELDAVDSPQANEEVSTAELKENDTFEVDTNMPIGSTATETRVINGVKTERKTRGLTQEEAQGGLSPEVITQKVSIINQQASNAQKALRDIVPDLKINVYASQKDFQDATGADGFEVRGSYKDGVVNINATLATKDTLGHEIFHAALLSNSETAQQARDTSALFLQSIARSSKSEKLISYAKRFAASYDPSIQNEEALAEMFGVMSATYSTLDISAKTRVKAFVAQLADMLGISGLFNEATTDKQIIDAFNALSGSVANGTTTTEGIKILRGSGTLGTDGTANQERFQADYTDKETGARYTYFKNDEQYQELVDKGQITNDRSFFDFDGVPMHLHTPDGMFTGKIEHKGITIAEGRGGFNFPAYFNDDNAFWASTPNAATSMANHLNMQLDDPKSDGKVRMMVVTSNIDKAFSSIDGTANSTRILSKISEFVPKQYKAKAEKLFLESIRRAARAKVIKRVKEIKDDKEVFIDKVFGLKAGKIFDNAKTPEQAAIILDDFINNEKSTLTFGDRKAFVEELIKDMTLKEKLGYTKAQEQGKGAPSDIEFRKAYQKAAKDLLLGSSQMETQSDFFTLKDGTEVSTNQPNAYFKRGISYMINEPLIRDQDVARKKEGTVANGSAYAVVEMKGRVKAIELLNPDGSQKHRSYRFAIVSEGDEKATTHILRDRVRAVEHYDRGVYAADHKQAGKPVTESSFLPTSGWSGLRYGTDMVNKEGARKYDEEKLMEPLTGRGANLKFPEEKTQRFQLAKTSYDRTKSPEIQEAATPVFEKLQNKEKVPASLSRNLAEVASKIFPVKKYDVVPTPASEADLFKALPSERQRGILNKGRDIADGTPVKLRLDINAYRFHNVWAPTIHEGQKNPNDFTGGKPISHQSTAIVTSARFGAGNVHTGHGQKMASKIASGESNKIPIATVIGSYVNVSEAEAMQRAEAALEDPSYIQVGMDPERRGYFYNRETMKEVIAADEVIQVGPLLMVKNPNYGRTPSNEYISHETDADIIDMRLQKLPNETHEQALSRILEKHNIQKEFDGVRKLLNYLYASGRDAGMDVSYMEQYFPRMVKDLAGLQDSYKGVFYDNEIERELDMYAKKKFGGRELDPIERQVFLENLAKNKIFKRGAGGVNQNAVNKRVVKVLDEDRQKKFYASPEEALDTYVESMISSINQVKLIGTARMEKGKRVQSGLLGQMLDADLQRGTLSNEALKIVQDAVEARFGMNGQQHGFIRGAKNAGYIAAMGNIGSAITQLGDFYFSAVQNGLVNTVQAGLSKKTLSREDVMGMKNLVTIEAKDGGKSFQKAVDFVFKVSGITTIDGFAKDTNINAALLDMRKRASKSKDSKQYQKLVKELSEYQGRDSAQTIADIRNGVNSDLVLEALYNRLSNVAPISLSEMPESYNRNPNARIIYSLKSYTIKQFDFIRNESFNKMGNSKTFAEGVTQLMRIATLAMVANGSADVLKAILFNREIDEEDLVWNNILRMFGITKYTTVKARQEGLGDALLKTIAPPQFGMLDDFSKDFDQAVSEGTFDIDELRSVKYLPFVGKLYYWREGRGKDVERRLSRLKD